MYVALNISGSSLKVLSLKGRKVKRWNSVELTGAAVRDGLILQPQAVGEAIDSLFKLTGLPRDKVVIGIAGLSFTYRFISLPRVKPSRVEEAILRAARKEISLPLDELYLPWQPLPSEGGEQAYFIVGVPRNQVDAAVQALKIAGVPPFLMDLRPLALARTANRTDVIAVNLEPDCFDIVFITGGMPKVIHTITPRREGATLEDNIHRLADELAKTAAFYQSNHPEAPLNPATPLLLTGELSAEDTARGLLQTEIEYPIESLIPPVEFPDNLPLAAYAATIGLALKKNPLKTPRRGNYIGFFDIDINVLAGKYRKPKAKHIHAGYMWLGVLLAIFLVLLYPLHLARMHLKTDNAELETNLNNVQQELNVANLVNEEAINTADSIKAITAAADAIKAAASSILGTRGDYGSSLQLVTGVIPPNTSFTSVEIRRQDITIQGEADSVFTVVSYAMALENENKFSEVRVTSLDEITREVPGAGPTDMPSQVSVITFVILITSQPPVA